MSIPSFLSDKHVVQEVNGVAVKFFPITVWKSFKLKDVGKVVMKTLQTLFIGGNDTTRKSKDIFERGEEGGIQKETEISAIDPQLAEIRNRQRREALEEAAEALMKDTARDLWAELLMNSMREVGYPPSPTQAHTKEFLESTDLSAFAEMVQGFVAANRKIFDPFRDKVKGMLGAFAPSSAQPSASTPTATTGAT